MSPEDLFPILNLLVMPAWFLLIVLPGSAWTQRLVHSVWIPVLLGSAYVWLAVTAESPPEGAGFSTLAGVMLLFDSPQGALAGWVHYLVFDLFVGAWEARDAVRRGVPHAALVPALVLTFLLGPSGLLLYLALRTYWTPQASLSEQC